MSKKNTPEKGTTVQTSTRSVELSLPQRYQPLGGREGGMGLVIFCADRQDNDRPVVLKVVKPAHLARYSSRLFFLQEVSNWIALGSHPNIVSARRVEQFGSPPQLCVVIDQVGSENEDASVAHAIQRRRGWPFGARRALEIGFDVIRGMQHAVRCIPGLVHRDLKPGNLLVEGCGTVRVTDFGIARSFLDVDPELWCRKRSEIPDDGFKPPGTEAYNAPEVWDPIQIPGIDSDTYSFGLILYELLTGERAVQGRNSDELESAHRTGALQPIPKALPAPVAEVIKTCTALERARRYQDWDTLHSALSDAYRLVCDEDFDKDEPETQAGGIDLESRRAIGLSYFNLGYCDEAEQYLRKGLSEVTSPDLTIQAEMLHALAITQAHNNKDREAIKNLDNAAAIARRNGAGLVLIDVLALLGHLYAREGQTDKSLAVLEEGLSLSRKEGHREAEIATLASLANAYGELGKTDLAVDAYQYLIGILKDGNDPENLTKCLLNLGTALLAKKRYKKAAVSLRSAWELGITLGDPFLQTQIIKSLSVACKGSAESNSLRPYLTTYLDTTSHPNLNREKAWAERELERLATEPGS